MSLKRKLQLLETIEQYISAAAADDLPNVQDQIISAVMELRAEIQANPADLVAGDFVVKFYWAEGDLDTGLKDQDVLAFSEQLHQFLEERGAASVQVYGPDGDRLPARSDR